MTAFAKRLIVEMETNQLTIANLAKKAGLNKYTIYAWIKDGKTPNAINAVAVATVLKTSVEYLITVEERNT